MLTEMILLPMRCGTVCVAYKLYFHFSILKTMKNFIQWSWNVSRITLINFMKWTTRYSFHLKSMRVLTEMDPDIQFYSSTHYALNTRCDYYIEDTFVTNIAEKNQYKNKYRCFITMWRAYPNIMMNWNHISTHWTSHFRSLLWLEIGWMSQNRTFMNCKVTSVYINFVKEKEEVASPYILKMGLVSPIGLTWNILTVRWSHYMCLPMSSLLSFIECQTHHWIYSMIVLQISWIP